LLVLSQVFPEDIWYRYRVPGYHPDGTLHHRGEGIIFSLCTRTTHTHVILYSNNKNKNNTLLLLPGHPGTTCNTLVMSTVPVL